VKVPAAETTAICHRRETGMTTMARNPASVRVFAVVKVVNVVLVVIHEEHPCPV
jgi:hypothetical protein